MMRLVEAAVFLSLAASAHVGLWAAFPAPNGEANAWTITAPDGEAHAGTITVSDA